MNIYCNQYINKNSFSNINISPEQLKKITESINKKYDSLILSEKVIDDINHTKYKGIDFFTKLDISGEEIFINITNTANKIVNNFKKNGINKKSINNCISEIEDMFVNISKLITISDNVAFKFSGYDLNKIKNAIIITCVIIVINSLVHTVFSLLTLNMDIAMVLTSVLCAPITEELGKQISVKGGFSIEFEVVFNATEFTQYFLQYGPLVGFKRIAVTRLKCVGLHITTHIIQWLTNNEKIKNFLGIKNKEQSDTISLIGHIIGMVIHAFWNAGGNKLFLK